jgi:hypothetical protein
MTGRIAYFIQCHESADRLKLLFRSIYHPDALIFIHCDKKSPTPLHETAARIAAIFPNAHNLESRWVSWGGYSQVEILIDALRAAVANPDTWDHFVLLSEHHVAVREPKTFADFLMPGISYFSSTPYSHMGGGQTDINYRFSADFRETPAWGMFPIRPLERHDWVSRNVHHGSNWVVLSREHCHVILDAVDADHEAVSHMRNSVQPDEMFVQTILAGAVLTTGSHVNKDFTYVAWPELSGTNDLTFVEANYFDAREKGSLFIRKSPKTIPASVIAEINAFAAFSAEELSMRIDADHLPRERLLSLDIKEECKRLGFTAIDIAKSPPYFCPKFYMKFTRSDLASDVFVGLISEDMEAFKLFVCWRYQGAEPLGYLEVAGYKTHSLKARVADLMMHREVLVASDNKNGFLTRDELGDAAAIASRIKSYIDYAKQFSERK